VDATGFELDIYGETVMNWKTWVPLILAIVLGVVAAKVARDTLMKNRAASGPPGKFVKIVVAKEDIQPGQEIKPEQINMAQVQENAAPASSFTDAEKLQGRSAEMIILKGQPIVEAMLAQEGSGTGLQSLVPHGMRAVTIEVNEFTGVAGLLVPNCHVDILATINDGANNTQVSKAIVQNVTVKALGQRTTVNGNEPPNPNEMFRSVTLLLSPKDAEAVELACTTGRPRLVLRGGRDTDIAESEGITLGELRGGAGDKAKALAILPATQPIVIAPPTTPPETVAIKTPPMRVVKLIRGGVESSVSLPVIDGTPENAFGNTDPFERR
jgi:pilus assembly protein CpaB